jgi:hypothetical protein
MCCCDKLHATLRNGARCCALGLCANFIDHNHLGHVVLNSLNHDAVLLLRIRHLQQFSSSRSSNNNKQQLAHTVRK